MIQKFVAVAAWALLFFVTYATVSPIQARPSLPTSSSIEHVAAFACVGVLFCLAYPRRIALVCLIVLCSAFMLELVQLLMPGRHARIQDAIEKLAGGAMGIWAGRAVLCFEQARRWFQN